MITGYYGLRFTWKKLVTLVLVCSFASWILFPIKHAYNPLSLQMITQTLFPLSSSRWWFMTYYVLLFAVSPLLNKGIEYLNRTQFKAIVLLLIIYQSLSLTSLSGGAGYSFQGFITIYLTGRYCSIYGIKPTTKTIIKLYPACFIALFILSVTIIEWLPTRQFYQFVLMAYANILITIMAICMFFIVNTIKPTHNTTINKCLKSNLFIYLFTEGIGVSLYKSVISIFQSNILLGIGSTMAIIVCSLLVGGVLQNIASKICETSLVQHFVDTK